MFQNGDQNKLKNLAEELTTNSELLISILSQILAKNYSIEALDASNITSGNNYLYQHFIKISTDTMQAISESYLTKQQKYKLYIEVNEIIAKVEKIMSETDFELAYVETEPDSNDDE